MKLRTKIRLGMEMTKLIWSHAKIDVKTISGRGDFFVKSSVRIHKVSHTNEKKFEKETK